MDPKFQTSFIPKKPIVSGTGRSSGPINLFSLLGTVIFVAALALTGGAFFYHKFLVQEIEKDRESLNRAKDAFDPDTINQIIRLDSRLEISKKLLDSHLSVTPFFDFLSSVTLKTVRFRDFSFSYLGPDNIMVTMKGLAQNYSTVALQSDVLNQQKLLKEVTISDMSLEATGNVSFNVSTKVDPSLISYRQLLNSGTAAEGESAPTISTQ